MFMEWYYCNIKLTQNETELVDLIKLEYILRQISHVFLVKSY